MLLDESENLSVKEKVERAFRQTQEKNIELFNSYVRGGIEVMYERFMDECREDCLYRTYEFITNFKKELEGTLYDKEIKKLLNSWK